ncbi:transposable element Tc1 transposase [Trichonephila clavipes]|nr:transposable element Tc1 transposase [Trichonephila clavipes]
MRYHDVRIRVRRYAGERCIPECVIERHSGLTPGVMVLGAISYHGRSNCYELRVISKATDMWPIELMWDLVGQRLARDPRPAASKDELLLRLQAIWNSLPQADIQNLFDSMSRRIATLIASRGGYTEY